MDLSRKFNRPTALALLAALSMALVPSRVAADDTDIFIGSSGGSSDYPNVLIILDNTSNWSTQAQHWPGGVTQGQSELVAIKNVVSNLGGGTDVDASVNVGLMMFTDNGSGREGGYIRYAIQPMTKGNKINFVNLLTTIYSNFGTPYEKGPSSATYSAPLFDAFKYFGGYTSIAHATDDVAGTPTDATHFGTAVFNQQQGTYCSSKADTAAYDSGCMNYKSPISTAGSCARNFIIFIGNGFPNQDDTAQTQLDKYLTGVGGTATPQISLQDFVTTNNTTCNDQGYSDTCSKSSSPSTSPYTCTNPTDTLQADTTRSITTGCSSGKAKFEVQCCYTTTTVAPTGTWHSPTGNEVRYADEWTDFLRRTDVSGAPGQQYVTTYTIDAFNAQESTNQTALLMSMARVGGGTYYPAKNEGAIETDLQRIFTEIVAVNSTFASASLPISATNRTVSDNQVFIGLFRPDPDLKPRWFGNLKQYQLVLDPSTGVALADSAGMAAVNPATGFITDCATSFWTSDSGSYWSSVPINPPPEGKCLTSKLSKWSDLPDGPSVEKGSVAEVIRKGNNPSTTDKTPTWAVNRTVNTLGVSGLTALTTSSSGLASGVVDFTLGKDVNDENGNANTTETRPSLHGDVVHSRPLAIDYGSPTGVVVFYGANDGTFRAVNGSTGKELWAFVANEFFSARTTSGGNSPLQRLKDNSPLVSYGTTPLVGSQPRDWLFDGSTGIYQEADNSKVWIFPTMRRGGRTVYGLDVKDPAAPQYKWKVGCPNLTDDTGCSTGMTGIGQTWSMPNVAFIKGYSTSTPVVAIGGGYDPCEDANTSSPACSTSKGNHVYFLDASTGAVLASFDTERSVIADIAYVDVDFDNYPDYAYAVDTGGTVYRIDFVDASRMPVTNTAWKMYPVAFTSGSGRKFQYAPAVMPNQGKVYVALGSGDREHPLQTHYPYTAPITNKFYVYLDDTSARPASKAQAVNLDDTTAFSDFSSNPTCGSPTILPDSTQKGWFITLNHGAGEQTVTAAAIAGGQVTFSTNRPIPQAAGTCNTLLGEARGYFVNLYNGSGVIGTPDACGGDQSATFVGGGLPPSPVLTKVSIGGNMETVLIGAIQKGGGPSSVVGAQKVIPPLNFARKMIYWFTQGTDNR